LGGVRRRWNEFELAPRRALEAIGSFPGDAMPISTS
jgi:hypothetical protein